MPAAVTLRQPKDGYGVVVFKQQQVDLGEGQARTIAGVINRHGKAFRMQDRARKPQGAKKGKGKRGGAPERSRSAPAATSSTAPQRANTAASENTSRRERSGGRRNQNPKTQQRERRSGGTKVRFTTDPEIARQYLMRHLDRTLVEGNGEGYLCAYSTVCQLLWNKPRSDIETPRALRELTRATLGRVNEDRQLRTLFNTVTGLATLGTSLQAPDATGFAEFEEIFMLSFILGVRIKVLSTDRKLNGKAGYTSVPQTWLDTGVHTRIVLQLYLQGVHYWGINPRKDRADLSAVAPAPKDVTAALAKFRTVAEPMVPDIDPPPNDARPAQANPLAGVPPQSTPARAPATETSSSRTTRGAPPAAGQPTPANAAPQINMHSAQTTRASAASPTRSRSVGRPATPAPRRTPRAAATPARAQSDSALIRNQQGLTSEGAEHDNMPEPPQARRLVQQRLQLGSPQASDTAPEGPTTAAPHPMAGTIASDLPIHQAAPEDVPDVEALGHRPAQPASPATATDEAQEARDTEEPEAPPQPATERRNARGLRNLVTWNTAANGANNVGNITPGRANTNAGFTTPAATNPFPAGSIRPTRRNTSQRA